MRLAAVVLAVCLMASLEVEPASAFLDPGAPPVATPTGFVVGAVVATGALEVTGNYVPVGASLKLAGGVLRADFGLPADAWPAGAIPRSVYQRQSAEGFLIFPAGPRSGFSLLGTSQRQLVLNRDAAAFVKAKGAVDPGATLLVAAEYSRFEAQGVRLFANRTFTTGRFAGRFFVFADLLTGSDYAMTTIRGPVTKEQSVLSITSLVTRRGTSEQGIGVAAHGGVILALPGGWEVSGTVENAYAGMWWGRLVQSEMMVNTNTTVIGQDGYATYVPTMTGSERTVDVWRKFPVEPALLIARRQGKTEYRLKMDLYTDRISYQPEIRWKPGSLTLTLSLRDLDGSVALGVEYGPASFSFATDDLNMLRATTVGIRAGYAVGF